MSINILSGSCERPDRTISPTINLQARGCDRRQRVGISFSAGSSRGSGRGAGRMDAGVNSSSKTTEFQTDVSKTQRDTGLKNKHVSVQLNGLVRDTLLGHAASDLVT